jgi:hypothetical protein
MVEFLKKIIMSILKFFKKLVFREAVEPRNAFKIFYFTFSRDIPKASEVGCNARTQFVENEDLKLKSRKRIRKIKTSNSKWRGKNTAKSFKIHQKMTNKV